MTSDDSKKPINSNDKPYDKLAFKIDGIDTHGDGIEYLIISMFINGIEYKQGAFDYKMDTLVKSTGGSGIYLISVYDCECDKLEHNEYIHVEAEHTPEKIIWKNFYCFYIDCDFIYDAEKKQYYAINYRNNWDDGIITEKIEIEKLHRGKCQYLDAPYVFDKREYMDVLTKAHREYQGVVARIEVVNRAVYEKRRK
jgi:hypothetical protein